MVERSGTIEDVYFYQGAVLGLNQSVAVALMNGPSSGTLNFEDGDSDQRFEAGETGTWNGAAASFVGSGTATAGVTLSAGPLSVDVVLGSTVPVEAFSTAAGTFLHYPEGDQSALLNGLASQILETPTLSAVRNLLGLDSLEDVVGYLEANAIITFDLNGDGGLFVCFTAGTMIETPWGEAPVESLRPGSLVQDRDGRRHEVLWHGMRRIRLDRLPRAQRDRLMPVIIPRDAFGPGYPHRTLRLSQQHRVMLSGGRLETCYGLERALTPARALLGAQVHLDRAARHVTYHHILCAEHVVLRSDGLSTETLLPRGQAVAAMNPAQKDELMMLFPKLETAPAEADVIRPALPLLKRREGALFAV